MVIDFFSFFLFLLNKKNSEKREYQCIYNGNHYNPPLTSETHLDLAHIGHKSTRGVLSPLALRISISPPIDWTEAGLKVSRDQCHAPDYMALRQTRPARWRQKGLYARRSPLARVPRARVRADGMWEGVFNHTRCLFRVRAPIVCALTSLHQREQKNRMERNFCWAGHCAKLHHHHCAAKTILPHWAEYSFSSLMSTNCNNISPPKMSMWKKCIHFIMKKCSFEWNTI